MHTTQLKLTGEFGVVYKATLSVKGRNNQVVAIKTLKGNSTLLTYAISTRVKDKETKFQYKYICMFVTKVIIMCIM